MPGQFRHYSALARQLDEHVGAEARDKLLAGMDYVKASSKPAVRVAWAREMMERLDSTLDPETCARVREGCSCVLSNEKSVYAQTFRKLRKQHPDDDVYLDEVVKYLNATAPLKRCGDVTRDGDRIYSLIAEGHCDCSCLRDGLDKQAEPISVTWCHCCKGSLLSVYRHVFSDRECRMDVLETIAAGGKECRFVTTYGSLSSNDCSAPM